MKILNLKAENVKRLSVVDITPEGDMVQITGRNGAGKTSVLDSIWWALGGTKGHQASPIRQGEESAKIELNLGEIVVRRKFRRGKGDKGVTTSLEVMNAEGATYRSPQSMLDDLLGTLTFDPLAFARMTGKEQGRAMEGLCPGIDFDAKREEYRAEYDKRREAGRTLKEAEARLGAMTDPGEAPEVPDVADLEEQLRKGREHNQQVAVALDAERQRCERMDVLQKEISILQERLRGEKDALERMEPIPARVDLESMERRLSEANELRVQAAGHAERRKRYDDDMEVVSAGRGKVEECVKAMDRITREISAAIEKIDLPVEGLALSGDELVLNGLPLDQASDAEQLRVSCAIAMQQNAKLRIIRVRDGSLLDDDSLGILAEMAGERDYQVWIERVDSSGQVGVVMEDGTNLDAGEVPGDDGSEDVPDDYRNAEGAERAES